MTNDLTVAIQRLSSFRLIAFQAIVFLAIGFGSPADAIFWGHENDETPPRYCVRASLYGAERCVNAAKARELNWSDEKIYGMSHSIDKAGEIDQAMKDSAALDANIATTANNIERTKVNIAKYKLLEADKNALFRPKPDEIKKELVALDASLKKDEQALDVFKKMLATSATKAGDSLRSLSEGELRVEIAKKGLLVHVDTLERKLATLEDNLRITEVEFNNTVLEAFVIAKLDKLASKFCEAQKMCAGEGAAGVPGLIRNAVASKELMNNFKKTPPASPPSAAVPAQ